MSICCKSCISISETFLKGCQFDKNESFFIVIQSSFQISTNQTQAVNFPFASNHFHSGSLAMWWSWSENQQGQLKFRIVEKGIKYRNYFRLALKISESSFVIQQGAARNHLNLFTSRPFQSRSLGKINF